MAPVYRAEDGEGDELFTVVGQDEADLDAVDTSDALGRTLRQIVIDNGGVVYDLSTPDLVDRVVFDSNEDDEA